LLDALGSNDRPDRQFFGGAIALAAGHPPSAAVRRLVLMGSVGVPFEITPELDAVWATSHRCNQRGLLDIFAHYRSLVTDELAELRYQRASARFQESFAAMFPGPRQRLGRCDGQRRAGPSGDPAADAGHPRP
jgi:2-hydroxymuconate-semialdehyde hydrolase